MRARGAMIIAMLAASVLAGCAGSQEPRLLNLTSDQRGPDEFAILPGKPLQAPQDYASLPQPTPGGANRADPTPRADAFAALGGNAARAPGGTDAALIARATRYGTDAGIRQSLAGADLEYRRRNDGRLLERLFNRNVYFKAYRPYELDQYRELERFRAAGIRTPAVPPEGAQER